ncbi:MAG: DUF805 domain-containing protein [Thermoguttaceae bacterium]|nr:DUF805 domain-containing protein [Thermoguttaceae bacterium]
MKCPKCQREHTLKRAENNTVVCAACGSRFPLKTPAQPAAPSTQTPVAPSKSRADLNPQYLDKLIADGKRADAPSQPTANVDDETLSDLLSGVKHIDDAPAPPQNAETTYSLRSEPTTPFNRPAVSPPPVGDAPFATRADVGTSQTSGASAQTSSDENRPSLFSWSGRATQREFLGAVGYYLLYSLALGVFLGLLFGVLGALSEADSNALRIVAGLGMFVVGLAGAAGCVAVTLILFAASARRLRDAGLSPYLTLLHFVVSLPLTIFLAVYPGETGKTDAATQPQTSENPRPNATQNAPSSFTSAATPPSTATLGWLRFFSWNAPARPTDLPLALGLYALTAVWLVAHLFFEFFFFDAVVEYFSDHDWLDSDAVLGHVVLNFIYLVFLFVRLAIFTLNLTAIGVSILTLAKGTRQ